MTGLRGTPVNRRISPPSKIDSSLLTSSGSAMIVEQPIFVKQIQALQTVLPNRLLDSDQQWSVALAWPGHDEKCEGATGCKLRVMHTAALMGWLVAGPGSPA
jgi:hypothetical protein